MKWLEHFDRHTKDGTVGAWRLLILDSHESHVSAKFDQYAKENKILCFYLPPHSSHISQPLDVGCFGPLKTYYGDALNGRMRLGQVHVDKPAFLKAFSEAFPRAFRASNVRSAFEKTGLVPWDPDMVLSQLNIHLRTPTPPPFEPTAWQSQTPSNYVEFDCQTELIEKSIRKHQDSSPTPIVDALAYMKKGWEKTVKAAVLLQQENAELRALNEELSGRKKRKRKLLKAEGPLSVAQGQEMIDDEELYAQWQTELVEDVLMEGPGAKKKRRCGKCGTLGHNARTCQQDSPDDQLQNEPEIIQIE